MPGFSRETRRCEIFVAPITRYFKQHKRMSTVSEKSLREQFSNVPNQLTLARLVLSVAVFALIPLGYYVAALVVFVIAAATDWIDGYWARKYGQVTKLGRVFDPFVDKILICGAFISLVAEQNSGIAGWMAVVVVGRELLVTVLRSMIEQSGGDFSASFAGKLKMVFQCAAVIASLCLLHQGGASQAGVLEQTGMLPSVVLAAAWLAVLSTIYSGVGYLFAAAKFLRV